MITMQTLDGLRDRVRQLHQSKKAIHVSISNSHPKAVLADAPVHIQYVSSQVFWIERADKNHCSKTLFSMRIC